MTKEKIGIIPHTVIPEFRKAEYPGSIDVWIPVENPPMVGFPSRGGQVQEYNKILGI